jgi:hypothetical protein
MTKNSPKKLLVATELLREIATHVYVRFEFEGRTICVKQISEKEYDEA